MPRRLLIPPTGIPVTTVQMSYFDALIKAVATDDAVVALARNYHNGWQETYMNARVKEFLDLHPDVHPFNLNICRTITLAVKDELSVSGFNTTEQADASGIKAQAKWAWDLWTACHMDSIQSEVHESALSDRETFVIVTWDYLNSRPKFIHNYRYTPLGQGGFSDGQGVWAIYENDDINQPMKYAIKQWLQTDYSPTGTPKTFTRRTIYFPDRIEKWQSTGGGWARYLELGLDPETGNPKEPWPIPWVDAAQLPLGIPAIHFRNVGMMPEAWDAIPIQDAVNKTIVDILASNDLTAFQMMVALGWYPTTDGKEPDAGGSNLLKVGPGQFIGSKDPNAKFDVVKGSDPSALVTALQDMIMMAAQVTGTPTSRFTTTKLIASAETLKNQDQQLKKKAQDRRVLFGDSWEACMSMARKLNNFFGTEVKLDETVSFFTTWLNNQTLEDLAAKKLLGIPEETLWAEAGYSSEQIVNMKKTAEYLAREAGWQSTVYLAQHPELRTQNNQPGGGNNSNNANSNSTSNTDNKATSDKAVSKVATRPTAGGKPATT